MRRNLQILMFVLALQGGVVLVYLAVEASRSKRQEPGTAPFGFDSLVLEEPQGVDLARVREPTLVHFWATWCPPCRDELPVLVQSARGLSQPVWVVTLDAQDVDWRSMLGDTSHVRVGRVKPETVRKVLGLRELPVTLLVEPGGQVTRWVQGARDWSKPSFLNSWNPSKTKSD